MPWKIHVAAEIVAARPQRRERRLQPRLQFDEAADRGRGALPHRQPHALELCRAARAFHGGDAQHEAVGALADVAGLDEARQRHRKHRPRQHAMRDPRGLPGRDRKARRDGGDHHRGGKDFLPPQQNAAAQSAIADDGGNRQHRLVIGGEVEGDAGAERDRHPGQQPPGARLGARPLAQRFSERRPGAEAATAQSRPPAPPHAAARSRHSLACRPASCPAPPLTLHLTIMQDQGYRKVSVVRIAEQMQNAGRKMRYPAAAPNCCRARSSVAMRAKSAASWTRRDG